MCIRDSRAGVVAYLGWPGFDGALVYSADTPTPETPESGAEPGSIVRFATDVYKRQALGTAYLLRDDHPAQFIDAPHNSCRSHTESSLVFYGSILSLIHI